MSRRYGRKAEEAVKKERWNRWRILLRRPEFQKDLTQLRAVYSKWVKGPAVSDLYGMSIVREEIDPYRQLLGGD